ncbi:MAG: response regulator [Balneolaceae bacterium]|nr:MAG: response regulator [Balneolaceae bacterium]
MRKEDIKGTVVIVEDDIFLSLVEGGIVERLGYKVVANAVTGEEAIEKIKEHQPDVVVMDVSLKGDIDGIEAVSRIRAFSNVPVIYLSGNSEKQFIERAKITGFVDYLIKPITHDAMVLPLEKATKKAGNYYLDHAF